MSELKCQNCKQYHPDNRFCDYWNTLEFKKIIQNIECHEFISLRNSQQVEEWSKRLKRENVTLEDMRK